MADIGNSDKDGSSSRRLCGFCKATATLISSVGYPACETHKRAEMLHLDLLESDNDDEGFDVREISRSIVLSSSHTHEPSAKDRDALQPRPFAEDDEVVPVESRLAVEPTASSSVVREGSTPSAAVVVTPTRKRARRGSTGAVVESSNNTAAAAAVMMSGPSADVAATTGRKKPKQANVECIVCSDTSTLNSIARCFEGHVMCKQCVTSYITKTLMPQGTVFWDRIKCGGSDTCGFLFGPEVKALLPNAIIKKVETKQMDVAHLVAGERDPTSNKWISKHSKDCPNCGVPIQKISGCPHMKCTLCRHEFWYTCECRYPRHIDGCRRRQG